MDKIGDNMNNQYRFAYNPTRKKFIDCGVCHSTALHNLGKQKEFDLYIRGIIKDNVLYLRTFYPLKDIDEKTIDQINKKSFNLLYDNKKNVLDNIVKNYGIKIKKIEYNVTNDLLKGILVNI